MTVKTLGQLFGVGILSIILAEPASAGYQYGFSRISSNSPIDVASQFLVEVDNTGVAANQVWFKFTNNVGIASSITDVYFDDGTLLSMVGSLMTSSAGVIYDSAAKPDNLPGGTVINFETTGGFSADSNAPRLANGVNTNTEWLKIVFNLQTGLTLTDTIAALQWGLDNPGSTASGLRIGLHVQGIDNDDSDSFVNGGLVFGENNAVPEPASVLVWMSLGAACIVCRRIRSSAV